LAGSYGLFLIGIENPKRNLQMITKGTGEFHKRLIQNLCPKCEQKLKIVKKDDKIFYDRHAGHFIELKNEKYYVIKDRDVVVVL